MPAGDSCYYSEGGGRTPLCCGANNTYVSQCPADASSVGLCCPRGTECVETHSGPYTDVACGASC